MTRHPITVTPETPVAEALRMMRENKVRRFPVIDKKTEKLVGIVTEKELLYASPSPATSLSMHEIHYLLSKLNVARVMSTELVTVAEDMAIEEAALLMVDNRVGALPVMRGEALVGIITETDLFKTFIELFSAREEGVRLTLLVPEKRGELATITHEISELGGNIISLGTFQGEDMTNRLLTLKVSDVPREELVHKMQEIGAEVIDVRMCQQALAYMHHRMRIAPEP
jgi:acetoin utilization protein AcuB